MTAAIELPASTDHAWPVKALCARACAEIAPSSRPAVFADPELSTIDAHRLERGSRALSKPSGTAPPFGVLHSLGANMALRVFTPALTRI
jgi:hypothetical protein